MQKLFQKSLKLVHTEIPIKLCNKSLIHYSQAAALSKYPKQQNVVSARTHLQNFINTSRTASWGIQNYNSISTNPLSAQKLLPGVSAANPLGFMMMEKKFFSSSNGADLKLILQSLNDALLESWRSWQFQPADSVLVGLVATNIAVYLLWKIADPTFMAKNFAISLYSLATGRIHILITHAFSHKDGGHLFSCMAGLYLFGTNIGETVGPGFMLELYLAGALGSSFSFLSRRGFKALPLMDSGIRLDPITISRLVCTGLGASGAVSALLYFMLLDTFLITPIGIYHIKQVSGLILAVYFIGLDIRNWVITKDYNEAHLGGAFVGALAWAGKQWI